MGTPSCQLLINGSKRNGLRGIETTSDVFDLIAKVVDFSLLREGTVKLEDFNVVCLDSTQ